ncbi:MAG: redox-sensing transcriptional repressor Rex, partial [Lawsonibacter sp.]|nr:redox-sensing transcriptional repressor Rex [Lawsonibacter sp.]
SRGHTIVVLGTGNLGRALIKNFKFSSNGFRLLAAFDLNEQVVGTKIAGVPVYHASSLESFLAQHPVNVGLLTVPISAAQEMGDRLVSAGVKGIWNFTNYEITFNRDDVVVESVHFSDSLLALSYMISQREDLAEGRAGEDTK